MTRLRFISAAAILALTAGAAFAQTPSVAPAKPSTPAAVVATPPAVTTTAPAKAAPVAATTAPAAPVVAAPAKPVAPAVASAPSAATAKKVDLNTATADELDKLPQIGPARSKLIIEARAKSKFKDWNDFAARNVIPSNAETAIKDLVIVH